MLIESTENYITACFYYIPVSTGPRPTKTMKTNVFWANYGKSIASRSLELQDYMCMAAETKTSTTSLILLKK